MQIEYADIAMPLQIGIVAVSQFFFPLLFSLFFMARILSLVNLNSRSLLIVVYL